MAVIIILAHAYPHSVIYKYTMNAHTYFEGNGRYISPRTLAGSNLKVEREHP